MGQPEILLKPSYHPGLYLGDSIKGRKLDRIMKRLEKKPIFSSVFLVTLSRNASDQLELYAAKELAKSYYRKNPPYIVGIAGSREEAIELVKQIVEECLQARGDCALKEYLGC